MGESPRWHEDRLGPRLFRLHARGRGQQNTVLSPAIKVAAAAVVLVGILAQSGGFFLHMAIGQPGAPSLGTTITSLGAVLLAGAILILVYGLITAK